MRADSEKRLLQTAIAAACLVPLLAGAAGIVRSAAMLPGVMVPLPVDLDSHFRYLSGLLLGIGIAFAFAIPRVERKAMLVRTLGLIVVAGGLARLVSLVQNGPPGAGHIFGLVMELGVVPAIMLWQARVARRRGR